MFVISGVLTAGGGTRMEYSRCFEQIRDIVKLTRSHHDMLVHANYHVKWDNAPVNGSPSPYPTLSCPSRLIRS
jgi:hypothetical protein